MFTGIVEETGSVERMERFAGGARLSVRARRVLEGSAPGDSISVEGVCLTVTRMSEHGFEVEIAPETLERTHLGELEIGDPVNLERSLGADGRFGGHFVQGHVDCTGRIRERRPDGNSLWLTIETSTDILRYVVPKGYVAVDGISLTVVDVGATEFTFMLVPFTREHVTLSCKPVGARVNLEGDILGKYIERLLGDAPNVTDHS
jgi:riboflavin synthase